MTLVAKLHLRGGGLPLVTAVAAAPSTTVEVEATMAESPERPVLFVWASGDSLDHFADALAAADDTVNVDCLDEAEARRLYRVTLAPSPRSVYGAAVDVGASILDLGVPADYLTCRLRFPDRDALVEFRELLLDADIDVTTRYLGTNDGTDGEPLTRKQRETLSAAVDAGYFAVPREATLADVADTLGISRQAASERLRRGMETLAIDATRDADDTDDVE